MARAKRTDRADARRRYRVTHDPADTTGPEEEGPVPNVLSAGRGTAASGPAAPVRRIGFMDSMRMSWHRPDIRADIASLPWLLRTRAFLVPVALVVAGVVAVTAAPTNPAASVFFQFVVLPPAMAPIFIAGFFAKRASYLLGFLVGCVDVIGYIAFVYVALPELSTDPVAAARQQDLIVSAIAVGPLSGILFASGAAWYRRFLNFSSAQRARSRQTERAKSKRPARS